MASLSIACKCEEWDTVLVLRCGARREGERGGKRGEDGRRAGRAVPVAVAINLHMLLLSGTT